MHQHLSHPPGPEPAPSLLDNVSDALLNAFTRVRKPDERFLDMRDGVDKFEEGLANTDRVWNRLRSRTNGRASHNPLLYETMLTLLKDLTADYHDLAVAVQGLGFLESGITDPLNHFSNTLLEFSSILRHTVCFCRGLHLVSLLIYGLLLRHKPPPTLSLCSSTPSSPIPMRTVPSSNSVIKNNSILRNFLPTSLP